MIELGSCNISQDGQSSLQMETKRCVMMTFETLRKLSLHSTVQYVPSFYCGSSLERVEILSKIIYLQ